MKVFLGVKKLGWTTPRLVFFRGLNSKVPTIIPAPFIWESPPPGWVLSRLFGIRDFAYLTVGIQDVRGKRNGDSG